MYLHSNQNFDFPHGSTTLHLRNHLIHFTWQAPVQTSMALVYETGGSWADMPLVWVDMVSSVVTPSDTLAGMACWSSQKLTQETMTSMQQGT